MAIPEHIQLKATLADLVVRSADNRSDSGVTAGQRVIRAHELEEEQALLKRRIKLLNEHAISTVHIARLQNREVQLRKQVNFEGTELGKAVVAADLKCRQQSLSAGRAMGAGQVMDYIRRGPIVEDNRTQAARELDTVRRELESERQRATELSASLAMFSPLKIVQPIALADGPPATRHSEKCSLGAPVLTKDAAPTPMPAYRSEWKNAIRQALIALGPKKGYRPVSEWLEEHCPNVPRPDYCIRENGRASSLTRSIAASKKARKQFQTDLSKVRKESFGGQVS